MVRRARWIGAGVAAVVVATGIVWAAGGDHAVAVRTTFPTEWTGGAVFAQRCTP
ncbi:hypothetical protein ABZS66_35130 [Dactylosporangium sp. NPDC005572]|uniref:hypothetical protein n=1 Tax=Dactylosporangium sp. NPDC005572 TaxID=3156889 RepID=UPI00339EF502